MKKLVLTAAVLGFAASMASAQVYSQNIVGYSKTTLAAESFEIVSLQFSGTNGVTTLGDAFSGLSENDVVFVWTGSGYTKYTYYGPDPVDGGWFNTKWEESNDVEIPAGAAVWLNALTVTDAVTAGQVPSDVSITVSVLAGFNLVSNPYPVAMKLSDLSAAGLSENDVVFVWTGSGYTKYTYYGPDPVDGGWYDTKWQVSNDVVVPVGAGCWLDSAVATDLVFTKNF